MRYITYEEAAKLLPKNIVSVRSAANAGRLTKVPTTTKEQLLIEEQVLLFKGKSQIRETMLSEAERNLWKEYRDLVHQGKSKSEVVEPRKPELSAQNSSLSFPPSLSIINEGTYDRMVRDKVAMEVESPNGTMSFDSALSDLTAKKNPSLGEVILVLIGLAILLFVFKPKKPEEKQAQEVVSQELAKTGIDKEELQEDWQGSYFKNIYKLQAHPESTQNIKNVVKDMGLYPLAV